MGEKNPPVGKKRPRFSGATAVLAAMVVFAAVVYGDRGLWSLLQLHQENKGLSREVEALRNDIASLKAEYREYGTGSAAIEKAAREELNLVKPGETVYKFGAPRP